MNTLKLGLRFVAEIVVAVAAAFGLLLGGLMVFEFARGAGPVDPSIVEARLAADPGVQAFLNVPMSYRQSVNATTDDFVAGWTESIASSGPLVRQLGALNARQIEFIREEIAPRLNYIKENNPPRFAAEQGNVHAAAVCKLVLAAR